MTGLSWILMVSELQILILKEEIANLSKINKQSHRNQSRFFFFLILNFFNFKKYSMVCN